MSDLYGDWVARDRNVAGSILHFVPYGDRVMPDHVHTMCGAVLGDKRGRNFTGRECRRCLAAVERRVKAERGE